MLNSDFIIITITKHRLPQTHSFLVILLALHSHFWSCHSIGQYSGSIPEREVIKHFCKNTQSQNNSFEISTTKDSNQICTKSAMRADLRIYANKKALSHMTAFV
ncbi:uncharacterized protein ASCRUDRAFT_136976 [Ascoidea rubescens DSM 1968]|uniref:Secreted protein n=1 Tax=Ascoidea rubescens DSM 1968 TaxID=1344418 RepID=A0A1D2VM49_9ASCO|nr:hypothetical protein ASCRUDRAFT_136976 [Ascoidea rubescens DSM 1968]ODV62654.1 hypothetical protein ASCRUDRAFT_136976 [Ascoidea rubescens DSM 1968]